MRSVSVSIEPVDGGENRTSHEISRACDASRMWNRKRVDMGLTGIRHASDIVRRFVHVDTPSVIVRLTTGAVAARQLGASVRASASMSARYARS